MSEERWKKIEDRLALEDVLNAYCAAIDSLSDMDGLLACFTEDAVLDLIDPYLDGVVLFQRQHLGCPCDRTGFARGS